MGPLTPQGLGLLGLAPNIRVFQLPAYFFEAVTLVSVVKDTP
jgi:hypothetical protein